MPPHFKGFPFDRRLSLDRFLEGSFGGQNRRVDIHGHPGKVEHKHVQGGAVNANQSGSCAR